MSQATATLIVKANGEMRLVKRKTKLALDETSFRICVQLPDYWGKSGGDIVLKVPEGTVVVSGVWEGSGADNLKDAVAEFKNQKRA